MKLTNSVFISDEKGNAPFMGSFLALMNQDLSVEKAMNILAISSQLDLRLERFNKVREKIMQKHGTLSEDGTQYKFEGESSAKFSEEMTTLINMEFDIEGDVIDITGEKLVLKAADIIRLKPILAPMPEITIPEEEEEEKSE